VPFLGHPVYYVIVACSVHLYAVGWNERPFGMDTRVLLLPSNVVLHRGPGLPTEGGDLGIGTPGRSHAVYREITLY